MGYGGEGGDGIYHSIYDDFEHFTRFNDTTSCTAERWPRPSG